MRKIIKIYTIVLVLSCLISTSAVHAIEAAKLNPIKGFDVKETVNKKSPIPLQILPKDTKGVVDWDGAVEEGYIKPLGVLYPEISENEENSSYSLDILIKTKEGTPSGVLFSHMTHTYWFDCKGCHPGIYKEKMGENIEEMTMEDMNKGESCGKCHNKVAFSMNNCSRCHENES